jgi:AraC-like DNA-binding protein
MTQAMSLAARPKELIENPGHPEADVLSDVLRTIRLSGAVQFCFMPTGTWQTDDKPSLAKAAGSSSGVIPFHMVIEGTCWMKMDGQHTVLAEGDIVAFPFGTGHQLGVGSGGRLITPMGDLPPKPWRNIPMLRYGIEPSRVRLLCGYLHCDAINFAPFRESLPKLLHIRTQGSDNGALLQAIIRQVASEADMPRTGGLSMLERLTEVSFIEVLRQHISAARSGSFGWLAAAGDPCLGRCLALIHENPRRDWSVQSLAAGCGLSRSRLAERFEGVLGTSPMRYLRDWRLCLASIELATTSKAIAVIAHDAGYGTEAAFNRAFSRAYGTPPATWRQGARSGSANGANAAAASASLSV